MKKEENSFDQVNNENHKRREKEPIQQNTKNENNTNLISNKNFNNPNYNTNSNFHYNTIPLGIANQNHATPKNVIYKNLILFHIFKRTILNHYI